MSGAKTGGGVIEAMKEMMPRYKGIGTFELTRMLGQAFGPDSDKAAVDREMLEIEKGGSGFEREWKTSQLSVMEKMSNYMSIVATQAARGILGGNATPAEQAKILMSQELAKRQEKGLSEGEAKAEMLKDYTKDIQKNTWGKGAAAGAWASLRLEGVVGGEKFSKTDVQSELIGMLLAEMKEQKQIAKKQEEHQAKMNETLDGSLELGKHSAQDFKHDSHDRRGKQAHGPKLPRAGG